jgi:histidine triad (HIT) family protein
MADSIFTQIIKKKIPSYPVYEDDRTIVILDIHPINKGHVLVIPKKQYKNIYDTPDELLAHMMVVAKTVSKAVKKATKADGINIIMNNEPAAGQMVTDHAHIHVIPRHTGDGFREWFGVGMYTGDEMEAYANEIKRECGR